VAFPTHRPRRLRTTPAMRRLVAETDVRPRHLVLPMFVKEGAAEPVPIPSMPGVVQHTRDSLRKAAVEAVQVGVGGLMLFGVPAAHDATGSAGVDPDGVLNVALRDVRAEVGYATVVMADTCLDEFTDHGHCGVLDAEGRVDNDATLAVYADMAVAQAVESQLRGDRKTYQQDGANVREALRELALDLEEGADIVMVKPAMAYLDVLRAVAEVADVPVAAYQVSGEYAMVEAAAANGWIERDRTVLETLTAIRRAGADIVLTYWATEVAGQLT
jgi:porphobilinogen synthase